MLGSLIIVIVVGLCGLALYLTPYFVARSRDKKNSTAIFALNVLLGWTLIGWVISLVWALTAD
jgi:hypothetical protein